MPFLLSLEKYTVSNENNPYIKISTQRRIIKAQWDHSRSETLYENFTGERGSRRDRAAGHVERRGRVVKGKVETGAKEENNAVNAFFPLFPSPCG